MAHRYRRGQIFKPPTAAESAASADAVEAFRHAPAQPQDRATQGSAILVKTPAAGIAARSSTTIYSATCKICIETGNADEKTIVETDSTILVYNIHAGDVPGDRRVMTGLTSYGTRYVERVGPQIVTVAKDGGVAGSASTTCTWTYTITDLAGTELATGLTPHRPRHTNVIYTQAPDGSRGWAEWVDDEWVLLVAFQEIENSDDCS